MGRKTSRKHKQKIYKMVGCSKRTRKNYLGKGGSDLAYTGKPIFSVPNPHLAYTGKGGKNIKPEYTSHAYPSQGPPPPPEGVPVFNNTIIQGGGCGCSLGNMTGGSKHRDECKCSSCKTKDMKGGSIISFVGKPWSPSNLTTWGNTNYYSKNTYTDDISRQMLELGGNPPFSHIKGGKRNKRKQRGGNASNFIGQDLINLGRQFQHGIGTAYNALAGYAPPVNPLPWKDQFHLKTHLNSSRI